MDYTMTARMEAGRQICTLCATPTYCDAMCAWCSAKLRVGKVIKTSAANYRQRDGVMEIKRVGEKRFAPVIA